MKRIWRWIRSSFIKIARIDSTPVKIAVGIGIGALIAMMPITGFQFLTGVLLSFIFRVNKVAVVVTTQLVCNPVTLPFLFFFNFKVGQKLIGNSSVVTLSSLRQVLHTANFKNFYTVLGSILKPLFLGSAITAPVIGLVAFGIGYLLIRKLKTKSHSQKQRDSS